MLQAIKNWFYLLITRSGIILRFLPIYQAIFGNRGISTPSTNISEITDDGGTTMKIIKYKGKYIYPGFHESTFDNTKHLTIRKDDVILCGYPKTGCHWVHEILNMLVTGKPQLTKLGKQFGGMIDLMPQLLVDSLPSPRVLNTHYLYNELPEQSKIRKTKIVLTVRGPKDTVVSFYHHVMTLKKDFQYEGTLENFVKLFMKGEIECGSYFDTMVNWDKVMKNKNRENPILLVEYEKLRSNTKETIKEIARFLEIDITDEFAEQIIEASKLSNMKAKQTRQVLLRKGVVGDWKNWLSESQSQDIDKMCQEKLAGCTYQPPLN